MKKSMYSLMLSDEVIAEIDRLAYKKNTNRSNMINQILAEYVSYITPEKKISQIFNQIREIFGPSEIFQTMGGNSLSVMNLRSSLDYKYNPSVKYSVELYRTLTPQIGQLKVYLRTQNEKLIYYIHDFFRLWVGIESQYIRNIEYSLDNAKFCRTFVLQGDTNINISELSGLIAEYIMNLDKGIKIYFTCIENNIDPYREIERLCIENLRKSKTII